VVVVALTAWGAGGCGGVGPSLAEPVSSSPPARAGDPAGAVRAWVEARNAALVSGDTTELRALSDPSCESCTHVVRSIEDVYAAGGRIRTSGWSVKSATVLDGGTARSTVTADVVFAARRVVRAAGERPKAFGPQRHTMVFKLHRAGGSLVVDFVGFAL
jgi:hypothetical protein